MTYLNQISLQDVLTLLNNLLKYTMKERNLITIEPILNEVKEHLKKIYGKKLKQIILYGSYARGEASEGSDIDLIILLSDMADPITEREKFFDVICRLDLKYDTVISVLPLKENQYRVRRLPLIANVKKEGISL